MERFIVMLLQNREQESAAWSRVATNENGCAAIGDEQVGCKPNLTSILHNAEGAKQTSVPFVVLHALRGLKKTEGFTTSPSPSKIPQVLTNFLTFAA